MSAGVHWCRRALGQSHQVVAMASKTVEDLTDEELLIVFRGPDSPLDAYDLINAELVCKRW
jgi:hypothetical protein